MNFDWKEYVHLAEELSNRQEASSHRASVSRAYYGVFCIARNKKGYKSKDKKTHWMIINEYKNSSNLDEQSIGRILDGLRGLRNDADYNEDELIDMSLAQRSVASAKQILTLMAITTL